jgi:hypothetical protein
MLGQQNIKKWFVRYTIIILGINHYLMWGLFYVRYVFDSSDLCHLQTVVVTFFVSLMFSF